ncbi:thiamine pyrophosphate-binding protein [Amycolatopsis jejuensis]|uniref:thiamine pyrophosphate-binding protein n=1 Tax=Amycolatopsis jejuensis TaxID=330084 RepID=UPI000525843E|nr:thiamine pyrophosphate-binding protein [Amycolatopsis jejuensis]
MADGESIADEVYAGLMDGGVDFCVSLPERVLTPVIELLAKNPAVESVICAREDEGMAIAAGAWLGGKTPVVAMEGSGVGYCGLILARMRVCRIPALVLAGHSRVFGEEHDYHQASALAAEGVFRGLDIPHHTLLPGTDPRWAVHEALKTCASQKTAVGFIVPANLLDRMVAP